MQVHNRGVRDGLLLTMIDQSLGTPADKPHDRDAAIERLAASCGCEMAHSRHVAQLAGSIFTQLAAAYELNPLDRPLLEAAARLQDVGYLINYDQHHKHSYHLILNSRLDGFQPNELELIANVARYHRGADPKRKHANFRQLSTRDQQRVRQMAAILRVAGGLDRSNTQQVSDVTVELGKKGDITLRVGRQAVSRSRYLGRAQAQQAVRESLRHDARHPMADPAEQHAEAVLGQLPPPRRHQRQSRHPRRAANGRDTIEASAGSAAVILLPSLYSAQMT